MTRYECIVRAKVIYVNAPNYESAISEAYKKSEKTSRLYTWCEEV